MMRAIRFVNLLLILLLWVPPVAFAAAAYKSIDPRGEITIITIGSQKAGEDMEETATKQAAIEEAQHLAVAAAMARIVPPEILTANFSLLGNLPFDSPEKFINTYEVLAVTETPRACRVLVRVSIAVASVQQAIKTAGILLDRENPPTVLALIGQKETNQPFLSEAQTGFAETPLLASRTVRKAFSSKGINVVDLFPSSLEETEFAGDVPNTIEELDNATAIELAKALKADFVVIGLCTINSSADRTDTNEEMLISNLSARLLNVETGEMLFQITEKNGPVQAIETEAENLFQTAAQTIACKFSPAIVRDWDERTVPLQPITIILGGKNYISRLAEFRKILNTIPDVENVRTGEMTMEQAVLTAKFAGSAEELAAELYSRLPVSFPVKIIDITDKNIQIQIDPQTSSW